MKNGLLFLLVNLTVLLNGQDVSGLFALTKHGQFSTAVREVTTGNLVHQVNGRKIMSPASVLKTITTFTALEKLGLDYHFKSELFYTGILQNGVLNGDLVLRSNGDPTLASSHFNQKSIDEVLESWVVAIQDAGISEIKGRVVFDDSYFRGITQSRNWYYKDLANYYACGVWSFNMHDNLFYLYFNQNDTIGAQPSMTHSVPSMNNWVNIRNELTSAPPLSGDQAYLFGDALSSVYTIRGTIPSGTGEFMIKGAIPRFPEYILFLLGNEFDRNQIKVVNGFHVENNKKSYDKNKTLWLFTSPSLFEIAKVTNEKSVNMFAEGLLRVLGEEFEKESALSSVEKGLKVLSNHIVQKGIDVEFWDIVDGSGLSPLNLISTNQLTDFYVKSYQDCEYQDELLATLAAGGQEGTLKRLFSSDSSLYGHVWAKSGSIENVYNLGGFMRCKSGKMVAFAIFLSEFEGTYATARKEISIYLDSIWKNN